MNNILPLVVGNWKMNGLRSDRREIDELMANLDACTACADVLICPPATLISYFTEITKGSRVRIGAQNCHDAISGAYTGDISAIMLANAGAEAVILGHSERRIAYGESNHWIKKKVQAAYDAALTVIVCVGETKDQRDAGNTLQVVMTQLLESLPDGAMNELASTVIAYEPIWAIGTGETPTMEELKEVHGMIRQELQRLSPQYGTHVRILYGGSLKPCKAMKILGVENVDGALVGGASLRASEFSEIISVYDR